MHKRREECDRLELGRNVLKLPKDFRYCDNHPMEIIKGKIGYYQSANGEKIRFKAKELLGPKMAAKNADHMPQINMKIKALEMLALPIM